MSETKKEYFIEQLVKLKVIKGPDGESLRKMDYHSLRSLLAIQLVVRE